MEDPRVDQAVDSDQEEEQRDQKEAAHEIIYEIDNWAAALTDKAKVIVCGSGTPQALIKIVMDTDLNDLGCIKVKTIKTGKTEEVATFHQAKGIVFIFTKSHLGGAHCGDIVDHIFETISAKNCMVVGLNTIYKTNYSTPEGLFTIDSEKPYPIKYVKTSHPDSDLDSFLAKNNG